jgi:hypothetical protein
MDFRAPSSHRFLARHPRSHPHSQSGSSCVNPSKPHRVGPTTNRRASAGREISILTRTGRGGRSRPPGAERPPAPDDGMGGMGVSRMGGGWARLASRARGPARRSGCRRVPTCGRRGGVGGGGAAWELVSRGVMAERRPGRGRGQRCRGGRPARDKSGTLNIGGMLSKHFMYDADPQRRHPSIKGRGMDGGMEEGREEVRGGGRERRRMRAGEGGRGREREGEREGKGDPPLYLAPP